VSGCPIFVLVVDDEIGLGVHTGYIPESVALVGREEREGSLDGRG